MILHKTVRHLRRLVTQTFFAEITVCIDILFIFTFFRTRTGCVVYRLLCFLANDRIIFVIIRRASKQKYGHALYIGDLLKTIGILIHAKRNGTSVTCLTKQCTLKPMDLCLIVYYYQVTYLYDNMDNSRMTNTQLF